MNPSDPDDPPTYDADMVFNEEGPLPAPVPQTDRELLERIVTLVEEQKADLATLRWRTGCLYAWLVLVLVLGILGTCVSSGYR